MAPYCAFLPQGADLIKVSDQDLEALLGMSLTTALLNPCAVRAALPFSSRTKRMPKGPAMKLNSNPCTRAPSPFQ